jgi:antitoxin (DNA-binding transcriptional repressor) of toxin-antitoxin stability system
MQIPYLSDPLTVADPVSITEARQNLGTLLFRVSINREAIPLLQRGITVAMLVPSGPAERPIARVPKRRRAKDGAHAK